MRRAFIIGSLTLAALDITDAITFWYFYRDVRPMRIFHSVAAGLLGRDAAIAGGWPTAILGAALHTFIATCIVLTYYFLAKRIPLLVEYPIACGLAYGFGAWLVMTYVVVPLSNARSGGRVSLAVLLNGILGHMLFVGLPAAFAGRAAVREARLEGGLASAARVP